MDGAYNREAVDNAIKAHNRRPRGGRIGRKEAAAIHSLLTGWRGTVEGSR